jgi:3-phenylpropionate/trans-cinnamate dioxygenase ferredoxin reductase subunit
LPTRGVAIVGAGVAGGRAAEALRNEGFDGRVVLIGDDPAPPYERPPLSKEVLRGERAAAETLIHSHDWFNEHEIDLRLGRRVEDLDPRGTLVLDGGEHVDFDACLLATGARPRRLELPGADLDGVVYLRSSAEAAGIAERLVARPRVVVIGAGFIGLEVAASARTVGCEVTVLEIAPSPLAHIFSSRVGESLMRLHSGHGVQVRLGDGIALMRGAARVEEVESTAGARYGADLVVVGVGVVPNTELALGAGITCDNGVVVDAACRTSAGSIYAAGDVARWPDPCSGRLIRVEHHQNAERQGPAAARSILGREQPYDEVPWFWSDQYDSNLQLVGTVTRDEVWRGGPDEPSFTVLFLDGADLAGALAVNRGRDIQVCKRIIARRRPVDRDRLADPGVDIAALLRGP